MHSSRARGDGCVPDVRGVVGGGQWLSVSTCHVVTGATCYVVTGQSCHVVTGRAVLTAMDDEPLCTGCAWFVRCLGGYPVGHDDDVHAVR